MTLALPLLPRGTATAETEAAEAARRAAMVVNILKVLESVKQVKCFCKRGSVVKWLSNRKVVVVGYVCKRNDTQASMLRNESKLIEMIVCVVE